MYLDKKTKCRTQGRLDHGKGAYCVAFLTLALSILYLIDISL